MRSISEINPLLVEKKEYLDELFNITLNDVYVIELSKKDLEKMKQQDWVVGFAYPRKQIVFVLNQDEINRNYEEWLKVIVHEMVHIYYLRCFETSDPAWLFEGLACYIADQKKSAEEFTIKDLITFFKKPNYSKGYYRLGVA